MKIHKAHVVNKSAIERLSDWMAGTCPYCDSKFAVTMFDGSVVKCGCPACNASNQFSNPPSIEMYRKIKDIVSDDELNRDAYENDKESSWELR